jgi:hypothetical protein
MPDDDMFGGDAEEAPAPVPATPVPAVPATPAPAVPTKEQAEAMMPPAKPLEPIVTAPAGEITLTKKGEEALAKAGIPLDTKPVEVEDAKEKHSQMILEKLLKEGYTGTVKVEYCRFRKKLTAKDLELTKKDVPDEIIALGQKRLLKKSMMEKLQKIEGKARDLVATYSTESFIHGYRFFTKKGRDTVLEELLKLKKDFEDEAQKFMAEYPKNRQAMFDEFPDWAKKLEPFYPSIEKVKASFRFEIIGLSDDYKITLVRQEAGVLSEATLMLKESLMTKLEGFLKTSVLDVRTEFLEKLSTIKDTLDAGDKVNAKTIKKVQEMIEEAKAKDLTGDEDFFKMLEEFGKKFTPDAAKSKNFKAEIEGSLNAILGAAGDEKAADKVVEEYVHRQISLD